MKTEKKSSTVIKKLLVAGSIIGLGIGFLPSTASAALSPLNLGSASTYGVLANAAITSATTSGVTGTAGGDIGVGGATAPSGTLNFSGATVLGGTSISALTAATSALADNRGGTTTGVELGSRIITPGAYSNPTMDISGALTLDALGDENAVFIFRTDSTLVTGVSSSVLLVNGAQACNVYWQIGSSATLGTSSTMVGHVIASASITTGASTQVNGQLIATTAAVTLGGTTIVNNLCTAPAVVVATPTPVATVTTTASPETTASTEVTATATPEVTATASPEVTATASPEVTATVTATPTPEVTATETVTPTPIPAATESPVIVPVSEESVTPVTTTGGKLPVTSSPWANLLLLGSGMLLIGVVGLASRKLVK